MFLILEMFKIPIINIIKAKIQIQIILEIKTEDVLLTLQSALKIK